MAPPLPSPSVPHPVQPFVGPIELDDLKHDDKKKVYDMNSKIMLASIVSLSVVVVLVTILHIYARWLLRRQARRRAALHRLGLSGTANNYTEPPPKTGLDPAVIASLPTFVFRHPVKDPETETATTVSECAVCLSVLEDDEVVRVLPNCNHTFHVECIDKWFVSHTTCPICRAEAQPVNQPDQPTGMPTVQLPTAPPIIERTGSLASLCIEGTSSDGAAASTHQHKRSGSITSLGSFKRLLSRERSSRRIPPEEESTRDLERQQ